MKAFKSLLLISVLALPSLAVPPSRGPDRPRGVCVELDRADPTFGHVRYIHGSGTWHHHNGGYIHGPVWHDDAYYYWNPATAVWTAAAGLTIGAGIAAAATTGCCS